MESDRLPSGVKFAFWEDVTAYRRIYHVAQKNVAASDANPGTAQMPFLTIQAAARILNPGEKVIVHEGIYRECVRPVRGGAGPDAMIAYEAAEGERVVVKGSDLWTPVPLPSTGYSLRAAGNNATIWMADLPEVFTDGYNPFLLRNVYGQLMEWGDLKDPAFIKQILLRRGSVFVDGLPLKQASRITELASCDGAFWVEDPGWCLHFRLPGDADPVGRQIEITVREQVFAPRQFGLGYIRVRGFIFEHAADGLPWPQRAAVSTMRGHHWIIEGNQIAWANACGMDIGAQSGNGAVPNPTGGHIIRNNIIRNCGICGLAGVRGVHHTLVEGNLIEYIGGHNLERMWECAGLKFHFTEHSLFRDNTFRHLNNAGGIWLDVSNVNNRITGNIFADIASLTGGVYVEMSYDVNLVDNNVFWDMRAPAPDSERGTSGSAVHADCNETLVVAHNFFGKIEGFAVCFGLMQSDRACEGRTGVCYANAALNNVFYHCRNRVHLGRREQNCSDGQLFDVGDDSCSFEIANPAPGFRQNLAGWQRYFGLDQHSTQAKIKAVFDVETGRLEWSAEGSLPETQPVEMIPGHDPEQPAGPSRDKE